MTLKSIAILPIFAVLAACGEQASSPDTDSSTTNSIEQTDQNGFGPVIPGDAPVAEDGAPNVDTKVN